MKKRIKKNMDQNPEERPRLRVVSGEFTGEGISKRFTLPLFMTPGMKWPVGLFITFVFFGLYLLTNHYQMFAVTTLPLLWIDRAVPLIPETVWVYLTEGLLFASAYFFAKDIKNINKMVYAFITLQVISDIIFWLYPTTFPRELYPLIEGTMDPLTFKVFSDLRVIDTPVNCTPSMHVSACFLLSFFFLNEQRKKFPFFFGWASLIALSTITTKQHYFIDVVTGLFLAVSCYVIFYKFVDYKEKPIISS